MFTGAKGGSSSFQQTPDNLRSNDTFEGVLGLCVGPIKGPTNGLKSIKLDSTAIENETGDLNYQDFVATVGDGDPLKFPQQVQLKLGAGASPQQVGLTLTNPQTGGSGPGVWATRTINNTNANFLDLRFVVQQLYRQDSKGVYNLGATLDIQMKPVGSTNWISPTLGTPSGSYNALGFIDGLGNRTYVPESYYDLGGAWSPQPTGYVINGKTTSPAVYELRIAVPNSGAYANTAWDVRVRLEERDSYDDGNSNQEKRTIQWESIAAVYSAVLGLDEGWRGVSWVQFYGKASDQLTGVPEVTGEYDTKIVSVPAGVFNPDTRQYTGGIWDGSWAKAFTNDPAWVINDAISDSLSGVSLIAVGSYLNKWDALELSKWCSTLVPDGNGGYQPRYSLNLSISTPQKAEDFVRYMAGAVGALAWDQGDGEWRCKVDKPDAPVDIFTLDNIEGEFIYGNTDVDTRYNDIIGQFKNAEMDYRQDSVELYDNDSIALIGRKPTTIALVGCTGRQEALRRVKLRLRSTVNENKIVTFTTNRRGRNIEQLSTILIADGDLGDQAQRTTGRLVAISTDRKTVTVRDPMYLAPGVAYQLQFAMPNTAYSPETASQPSSTDWTKPTVVVTRNVVGTSGAVTTLTLDQALPTDVADNLSVALTAPGLVTMPRLFRVTNVAPADDGERVSISAINIDIGKWDASDNVSKQDTVFQDLRGAAPVPTTVEGHPLLSLVAVPIAQGKQVNLQANWIRPSSAFLSGFRIQYSVNGGALQTAVERQQTAEWELPNAGPGKYHVEICSMDRRGGYSLPLAGDLEVTQALIDATQISYISPLTQLPVATVQAMMPAQPGADVTGQNTAQDTKNVAGTPAAQLVAAVAATSPLLDTTPPPVPTGLALTSTVKTDTDGSQIVTLAATWNAITAPKNPLANYVLALKESTGAYVEFAIGASTAPRFERIVGANTLFTAKVRAVDANNNTSAYSTEVPYTTTKDTVPPAVPTGLAATTSVTAAFLSWTNPADADLSTIEIWEATTNNSAAATKVATVNGRPSQTGGFTRTGLTANTAYYYWLKAVDTSGNASGFGIGTSVTIRSITNADLTQGLVVPQAVASLPAAAGYTGPVLVFNQADGKLYRYTGGAFVASTATTDLTGSISDSQVTALSSTKLLGQLTDSQLAALSTTKLVGTITNGQIGAGTVSADKFATGLQPLRTLSSLSDTGIEGNVGIYQGKVYRYTGGAWTTSVASSDISGTISDAQVAGLAASKITGQLSDTQLAAISAAKLIGTVSDTQVAGLSASKVTGQLSDSQLSAISAAKLLGQVSGSQIVSGAVTIGANGQLGGIGSGAVTITGLGYSGDLAATKNIVTTSTNAPTSPVNGDIWNDTSTSPATVKLRIAGAWTIASNLVTNTTQVTDGANLGGTAAWSGVSSRPANVAALTGSEAIQNTGIIISSGYLYGIGTGNATPVSNNLISIDGSGALQGITGGGVAVVNSNISVQNNSIYGVGIGNGTAVANAGISVNADGSLTGAGGGRPSLPSMAGVLTDAQIAALSAAKLTGQITTTQITDGGITTAKLGAGAVTTANLAASAVTAGTIAAGAITIGGTGTSGNLYDAAGNPVKLARFADNLVDLTAWKPAGGAGDPSLYNARPYINNGGTTSLILSSGPSGASEVVLKCTNDGTGAAAQGGFQVDIQQSAGFDPSKTYRYSLWVKKDYANVGNGYCYFGLPSNRSDVINVGPGGSPGGAAVGNVDGNPYWASDYNPNITSGKWYLLVGIVHGSSYTGGASGTSGMYDPATGQQISTTVWNEFKWVSTANDGGFRAFQYYGETGKSVYFARLRVEEVTSATASIAQMMATVGAPAGSLIGGTTAGTIETRANDPAAWINAGSTTTINGGRITTGSITAGQIAAGTITADRIATGAITISSSGALSTGGQVTIGGLGYTGVMNAGSVISMTALGSEPPTIKGNSATKSGSANYTSGVRGPAIPGAAYVQAKAQSGVNYMMAVLDTDPNGFSYQPNVSGQMVVFAEAYGSGGDLYLNGAGLGSWNSGSGSVNKLLRLVYDGRSYRVSQDGIEVFVYSTNVPAGLTFYPKFFLYDTTASISDFTAGPWTDNSLTNADPAARINSYTTTISGGKITTGSVTALQIAAGTITAANIATGAITISSAGALSTGGQVTINGLGYTGDLTATRGDNLVINSGLSTDASGWGAPGGTNGNFSRVVGVSGDPVAAYFHSATSGYIFPNSGTTSTGVIPASGKLFFSAWARSNSASNNIRMGAYCFDGTGAAAAGQYVLYDQPVGVANTWVYLTCQVDLPGNTAKVSPWIEVSQGGDVGGYRVSHVQKSATVGAPTGTLVGATLAQTVESYANDPAARVNSYTTTISGGKITTGSVTALQIAAGTITANNIAGATITANQIASRTIIGANLIASTITSYEIAAATITAANIAAGTITAGNIAAGTIQASNIAAGTITGDRLAANTITAANIAAGTITGDRIAAGTIQASQIATGAITISSAGVLSNGGGSVSLTGLGFTGDTNAGKTITLTPLSGNCTVSGSSISGAAGGYSTSAYAAPYSGPCYAEVDIAVNCWNMVALSVDNTTTDYSAQSVMAHFYPNSSFNIYVNGSQVYGGGSFPVTTGKLTVSYDGVVAVVSINGKAYWTGTAPAAMLSATTIYPKFYAYSGQRTTGCAAGPFTNNTWSSLGGAPPAGVTQSNLISNPAWKPGIDLDVTSSYNGTSKGTYTILAPSGAGVAGASVITSGVGPSGVAEPILVATGQGNYGDGGAYMYAGPNEGFDPKKTYRMSLWMRLPTAATYAPGNVGFYVGTQGGTTSNIYANGVTNVSNNQNDGNPYMVGGNSLNGVTNYTTVPDKWYLFVGYIHGCDYTGGHSGKSGFYDPATGQLMIPSNNFTEFKWVAGTTVGCFRFFAYNPTQALFYHFARPSMTEVNSAADLSVQQLLATVGAPAGTLVGGTASTLVESYALDPAARVNVNTTTINGGKITTGSITAGQIAARTLTAGNIVAGAITSYEIAARTIIASNIVAGAITSTEIAANTITANNIVSGTITGAQIAAGTISASNIVAGTITGNLFNTGTSLPGTITVGATGVSIATVQSQAASPAATVNAGSTLINSGMILVAGSTTLANWRNGGDNTKIEGGALAANTVAANVLTIGNRGISVIGLDFNYSGGALRWSEGYVLWTDDSGNPAATYINAGSATWGGGSYNYIFWTKGNATLTSGVDNWQTAQSNASNSIIFVTWRGGAGSFVANYGGTIITGDRIVTGTITASQIAGGTITGDRIAGGTITGGNIAGGTITGDRIAGNTITGGNILASSISANKLNIGARQIQFEGLNFTTDRNQTVSWTNGNVYWMDDNGNFQVTGISGGSYTRDGNNGNPVIIWWYKGQGNLQANQMATPYNTQDDVQVALYFGYTYLTVTYGRTVIDGDYIKTGTVQAAAIVAGTITTDRLQDNSVTKTVVLASSSTFSSSGYAPSSGSSSGGSSGGGGTGAGGSADNCVALTSFLPHGGTARNAGAGSPLYLLNREDDDGYHEELCEAYRVGYEDCVRIMVAGGATLIASKSTPITSRGGVVHKITECFGVWVPVLDGGVFGWDQVVDVAEAGMHEVALITAGNGVYAAGEQHDRYIFTHNIAYKP